MSLTKEETKMEQDDELSLWLAGAWLRTSGDEIQSLLVQDLQEQVEQGQPMVKGIAALSQTERHAGDFGMEIAGTLLAPLLLQLLKDFWTGYLKKLGEGAGGVLAEVTTKVAKDRFLSMLHADPRQEVLAELQTRVDQMVARKKLSQKEATRLLDALRNPKLSHELADKR
jgi:hypothetical protein